MSRDLSKWVLPFTKYYLITMENNVIVRLTLYIGESSKYSHVKSKQS